MAAQQRAVSGGEAAAVRLPGMTEDDAQGAADKTLQEMKAEEMKAEAEQHRWVQMDLPWPMLPSHAL